jgi:hypothetical protein
MNRNFLIFTIDEKDIDEYNLDYHQAITWGHQHLNSKMVIILTEKEIELLSENILVLINEENNSMIGLYEDGVIFENIVRQKILNRLTLLLKSSITKAEKEMLFRIISVFEYAAKSNRNVYFAF